MFRPMLVLGCVLVAASALIPGCREEIAPSRVVVRASAEPSEIEATPMTGVNVGNSLCRYVIHVRAYGGVLSEIEWLGTRETLRHGMGTDTTGLPAEQLKGFFVQPSAFEGSSEWGWGGPTELLPITIDNVFYYRRRGEARQDSTAYHVVCR